MDRLEVGGEYGVVVAVVVPQGLEYSAYLRRTSHIMHRNTAPPYPPSSLPPPPPLPPNLTLNFSLISVWEGLSAFIISALFVCCILSGTSAVLTLSVKAAMLIPQVFWIPTAFRGGVMMSWTRERVFFMKERYCSHHPEGGRGGQS